MPKNETNNTEDPTKTAEILTDSIHDMTQNLSLKCLQNTLDQICSQIAKRFNLYNQNGRIRKGTIVEVIARYTCLECAIQKLSKQKATSKVDALYKECHMLAVGTLVEELYRLLNQMGYNVLVSTEAQLEYGKVDILITVTNYGLSLKNSAKELLVEVKTGNSLSLTQIFRYLLDSKSEDIIVWRIRKRQVLVFNVNEIKPLLTEFVRILCLRGIRILSSQQILPCQHQQEHGHQPKQEELEEMFSDFSKALIETLPSILQIIIEKLGISTSQLDGKARNETKENQATVRCYGSVHASSQDQNGTQT